MDSFTNKKFICIRCPRGCEISTSLDGYGNILEITGNNCNLGIDYVKNEFTDPRRTLTTTIRVKNGVKPLVPVWTSSPIPKDKIFELADAIRNIIIEAPVEIGQIVLENALGLNINVVASGKVAPHPPSPSPKFGEGVSR
jgi:CxxC motif-containing protein